MRISRVPRLMRAALLLPATVPAALAAGGGDIEPIVFVADSRRHSGLLAWLTNLYNDNLFLFALLTVIAIPLIGLLLGTLTTLLMSRLGIDLKSRVVADH